MPLAQRHLTCQWTRPAHPTSTRLQVPLGDQHLPGESGSGTLRREMLGEGMLSPDEFGSLSLWASQLPGGLPAEGVTADGRLINVGGTLRR